LLPASVDFLLDLFFDPDNGDDVFLKKVGLSPNNTALQYGKPYSSFIGRF
jgi:hypothetical protein